MKSLSIAAGDTGAHSSIKVGRGLVSRIAEILDLTRYSSIAIISDCGASLTSQTVMSTLGLLEDRHLVLQGGEACKSVEHLARVWAFLSSSRLDRRSLVIAIGGGVITDLVGFAAATYMRGVSFVAIPTTLLAQVDASVGGKNGINLAGVKNIVGTIRQPDTVIIDTETLSTLPPRELLSGFAEIVKHGLIADRAYYEQVTSRSVSQWTADELVEIIFRSCEIKGSIVQADPRESGARKSLNFGHTLGHAIEALALRQNSPIAHGEAVAIGMHAAAFLSCSKGNCSEKDLDEVVAGLKAVGLPVRLPVAQQPQELLDLVTFDKKNIRGESRWTLLNGLGSCVWDVVISEDLVRQAIAVIQPSV